ncbi:MAG: c-type cytochrome [Candidatus Solibacter sp.]
MKNALYAAALLLAPMTGAAQQPPAARETLQKVCGACHPVETATGRRRTRAAWQESINSMVSKGAKATEDELNIILDYLSSNFAPAAAPPPVDPRRPNPAAYLPGSVDKHVVNDAAAARGRKVYAAECINCHGTHARGSEKGADLVRSEIVLHDRYGSTIGPFLKKGHATQTTPFAELSSSQIEDLCHTIHQEVYNTLRSALQIQNVLTGDPKAGAAYFNGAGKCSTCHSPTGDLAKIGSRLEPPAIQQRFLFPRLAGATRVTVTVTPASGPAVTGTLVHLDDFNVALRDSGGEYRNFPRAAGTKVVKHDPLQTHHELLDQYTDKNMHDIVAYLESLK